MNPFGTAATAVIGLMMALLLAVWAAMAVVAISVVALVARGGTLVARAATRSTRRR